MKKRKPRVTKIRSQVIYTMDNFEQFIKITTVGTYSQIIIWSRKKQNNSNNKGKRIILYHCYGT